MTKAPMLGPVIGTPLHRLPRASILMASGPSSPSRSIQNIDIYCDKSRAQWSERFGITDAQLRQVVRQIGPRASTVAAHLGVSLRG
ncbi:MAG: DUF3606 domain-containing protein [Methylobacterium frigidaeris]